MGGASLSLRLIVTFSQISNSAQNSSFVTDQAWKWNIENFGKFRAANQGHIISDIKLRIIFNCHPPHHYKIFLTNKLWAGTWAECVTEWTWNMTALSYIISQITDTYIPNIISQITNTFRTNIMSQITDTYIPTKISQITDIQIPTITSQSTHTYHHPTNGSHVHSTSIWKNIADAEVCLGKGGKQNTVFTSFREDLR